MEEIYSIFCLKQEPASRFVYPSGYYHYYLYAAAFVSSRVAQQAVAGVALAGEQRDWRQQFVCRASHLTLTPGSSSLVAHQRH